MKASTHSNSRRYFPTPSFLLDAHTEAIIELPPPIATPAYTTTFHYSIPRQHQPSATTPDLQDDVPAR